VVATKVVEPGLFLSHLVDFKEMCATVKRQEQEAGHTTTVLKNTIGSVVYILKVEK
jgi:hypothetical protein